MSKKNIVVLGGGYAGVATINKLKGALPGNFRIVLVEKQEFMYARTAALRAATSEDIADDALIPYDKIFTSPDTGVVVKASVTQIKQHSVVISTPHKLFGSEIDFEYLVIAIGSSWRDPVDLHTDSRKEAIEVLAKSRKVYANAKRILIIGGGPVGIELSGEIKMAYPDTNVTIVHANHLPLSDHYPEYFRQKIVDALKRHDIEIILGDGADLNSVPENGNVRLRSGKSLSADLVTVAVGSTPRGEIIKTLSPELYNPQTRSIKVNDSLQLDHESYPNIFVAGDVADTGDLKMAYKTGLHGPIVAKNILDLIRGKKPSATYKPITHEMMALPLGKNGGISYLPFLGGFTLGDWATKTLKGKHLFVAKARNALGY